MPIYLPSIRCLIGTEKSKYSSCRRHIVTKTRISFPDVPPTSYCDEKKFFRTARETLSGRPQATNKKPLTKLDVETNTGRPGDQALPTGIAVQFATHAASKMNNFQVIFGSFFILLAFVNTGRVKVTVYLIS